MGTGRRNSSVWFLRPATSDRPNALAGCTGLLLRIVIEMAKGNPDTVEETQQCLGRGVPDLIGYLSHQMADGYLRRMTGSSLCNCWQDPSWPI